MKKLENWIIKITDKEHYEEVIKVLNDFGYNTEDCVLKCNFFKHFNAGYFYCYSTEKVCFDNNIIYNDKMYTLEEFVKAHNNFKNMKFRINSKEEDEKLQKYLFSLGYKWCGDDGFKYYKPFGLLYNIFLYTSNKGIITHYAADKQFYENNKNPEYTLEEIINYELKEVVKVNCKNCGKEIDTNMKNHFKFNNGSYLCWDCFKEVEHACFPF